VNEISELGALDESTQSLNLISVDIEMLCQQAINIWKRQPTGKSKKFACQWNRDEVVLGFG